ncbi:hypothetical protein K8P10_001955 [Leucobacter sp. Psy1]|uniref:hypothetical protein n=1 Tax=Leucobacter sp. Psy1 TaxID=2875729 RepID=UPI001CD307C0|nr:hypothetical protein [Leucobacter sp. Psy1]UBH06444.1 hypothetical protein K8P10_001955 [Leucobacter sp. Psy1]
MDFWTILGAAASVVAAVGVTIQLTVAAFTRKHGQVGVSVSRVPDENAGELPEGAVSFMFVVRPMGNAVLSDVNFVANPYIDMDSTAPEAHLDANSEPVVRFILFPEELPEPYKGYARVICYWVAHIGAKPRPLALLLALDPKTANFEVFDLRRSRFFGLWRVWRPRKLKTHPSLVRATGQTDAPVRAIEKMIRDRGITAAS